MASSDDEDLKLAISLSLQTADQGVICLDDDEDEVVSQNLKTVEKTPASASTFGLLGIDRRKMEQERLARKRRASASPPPGLKVSKKLNDGSTRPSQHEAQSILPTSPRKSGITKSSSNHNSPLATEFKKPIVKKTWAFRHPRTGNDIKIEEVLRKSDLNLAVLSSFQWDMEWLMAKLDTISTS